MKKCIAEFINRKIFSPIKDDILRELHNSDFKNCVQLESLRGEVENIKKHQGKFIEEKTMEYDLKRRYTFTVFTFILLGISILLYTFFKKELYFKLGNHTIYFFSLLFMISLIFLILSTVFWLKTPKILKK